MRHTLNSYPKLALFKVTYKENTYYTLIDEYDRDELALIFIHYEQTHVKQFRGPEEWVSDAYLYLIKLLRSFTVAKVKGLSLYDKKHINEIWALITSELEVINIACENIKE